MSKQKQFNNRLNDLFADMGEEQAEPTPSSIDTSGWNWECDGQGLYLSCSSDVKDILGIEAADFLGQPIDTFLLSPESSRQLGDVLAQENELPIEITLYFQNKLGSPVPIRTNIFRNEGHGWRGFSQVIQQDEIDETPEDQEAVVEELTQTPESPPPSKPTPTPKSIPIVPSPTVTGQPFGVAVDGDQSISISSPYSGAGKQSLKQRQIISNPSAPGIEAALAVPVNMTDQSLGILEIIDPSPNRDWNEDELSLVEEVANQLALALENAQLFQETQSSLARTEALFQVGQAAIAFDDLTELLQSVTNMIAETLPANRTLVAILDQPTKTVTHFIESYAGPIEIGSNTFDELMNGLTGWAIREKQPAISNVGMEDNRESDAARAIRQQTDAGSVIVVPLIYRNEVYGTITAINSFSRPGFTRTDTDLLLAMSNQVATALANNQLFQQVTTRSQRLQTAAEVSRAASSILDPNPLITQTANLI